MKFFTRWLKKLLMSLLEEEIRELINNPVPKLKAPNPSQPEQAILLQVVPHPTIAGHCLAYYGRSGHSTDPKDPNCWIRTACLPTNGLEGEELIESVRLHSAGLIT